MLTDQELERMYKAEFEHNIYYMIPFLLQADEYISLETLAERFNYYEGFYQKYGMTREQAKKDFIEKLRVCLDYPYVRDHVYDGENKNVKS